MEYTNPISLPLLIKLAGIAVAIALCYAIAFAQCMPNDLTCMNLP